jgi:sodium transport system ATP-binding protein
MIKIENISKYFKKSKVKAVQDVSFTINDNEIFALLGPNGAGKTTTMRMVATLLTPTNGTIWYDDLSTITDSLSIKKRIGFLTNEIRLDGQFTPNQLADFYGSLYGMNRASIEERKQELFEYFGILKFANRKYETFSTGMKQKTSIAICLLHDPDIIIFDEPTNGLDVLTQRLIEKYILHLKAKGKCIIISTHLLDVVKRLADRVGVIIDGKSVFCGTCDEMIKATNKNDLNEAFVYLYEQNHQDLPTNKKPNKNIFLRWFYANKSSDF